MSDSPTKLGGCGNSTLPIYATNLEPLRWNRMVTHFSTDVEPVVELREYFMDEELQFQHVYERDESDNTITITVR